jgi:Regulator of Ty1 transposition protein 107 BRCT domain
MVRTQKFLCALASGATILSSEFIDTCLEEGEVAPVEQFLLKDSDNEKRFKLKLKDAVKRAKINKRRLLQDVAICCTSDINNGPNTFKAIVESNGGTFYVYRGRGGFVLKKDSDEDIIDEPLYLLSGVKPEEKKLWPKFEEMARAGGMQPRIVVTEWLLDTAMSQEMRWDESYLTTNALA